MYAVTLRCNYFCCRGPLDITLSLVLKLYVKKGNCNLYRFLSTRRKYFVLKLTILVFIILIIIKNILSQCYYLSLLTAILIYVIYFDTY